MFTFPAPTFAVANDIKVSIRSFSQIAHQNWSSQEISRDGRLTVRTWSENRDHSHQCWIRFEIQDSSESSSVTAFLCDRGHDAGAIRQHVFRSLVRKYPSLSKAS